jgi:hypothetical protein
MGESGFGVKWVGGRMEVGWRRIERGMIELRMGNDNEEIMNTIEIYQS